MSRRDIEMIGGVVSLPGYDRWRTEGPPEEPDGDICAECGDLPGFRCGYCGGAFCDAHIDDHGDWCRDEYGREARADAAYDDENEEV